jgi:hypothetical protein
VISRLLIVRATRRTRELVRELDAVVTAAFPASPSEALAALRGDSRWPGPALLWAHPGDTGYRITATSRRGARPARPGG